MVSDRLADAPASDRAQLLLVGAIAIALVLIGLSVVLNSAMLTTISGAQGTTESIKESTTVDHELAAGVGATTHQANVGDKYDDKGALNDSAAENAMNLTVPLQRRTVEGSGATVVLKSANVSENGTRIVQDDVGDFTAATGYSFVGGDWYPVGNGSVFGSEGAAVGWFDVTVDPAQSDTGDVLRITADYEDEYRGETDRTLEVEVANATHVELRGSAVENPCSVPANETTDRVTLLVSEGVTPNDPTANCSIDLLDPSGQQQLRYHGNTSGVQGTYNITVNRSVKDESLSDLDFRYAAFSDDPHDEPHLSYAAWRMRVGYTYDVDEVTAESERREVDVYG